MCWKESCRTTYLNGLSQGYFLTPPRANAYRQRVFLPRQSVRETALLGLIGKASPLEPKARQETGP